MFLAFWESIGIQRPQTRQISWHGVTQTFETMEAYDSCQVEEETMQSWLVMAHKPQAILSQATGIMADSFRMKTASDNNTLKVPNWRYSRYTWLTCSFLCHPLMLFYLVWPWMFVCVCATGVEVDLQCTDVASLFYVLSFFVFYICMLVVWKHPVFTQHVKIARWITCHMSHVNVSYISFPRKKHIL